MKIIDLLVKIANKEEIPKKIKFLGSVYEAITLNGFIYYIDGTTPMVISPDCLNDKVEIIGDYK